MTAKEWYKEITRVLDPTDPFGQRTQDGIEHIVARIRLEEANRAAGVARGQGCDRAADQILATSPGKGESR